MNKKLQLTSHILMVQPVKFGYNKATAFSNAFQNRSFLNVNVQEKALMEFRHFSSLLQQEGIDVLIVEDTPEPHTPDSIFPNNWITTHDDGTIYLYPMETPNRRSERREDLIHLLKKQFLVTQVKDLSYMEAHGHYLEGTGSMVFDRVNRISYACLSPRTHQDALHEFSSLSGYKPVSFHALGPEGKAVYHTNVMMYVGEAFAVVCLQAIPDREEVEILIRSLKSTGKEIIEISTHQMSCFAGNLIQLISRQGEKLLVLSRRAFDSLNHEQKVSLEKHGRMVTPSLQMIEDCGGGSARCMIAEIHLPALPMPHFQGL